MRMFSPKEWEGWGQFYTVWDVYLPTFNCPWEVERIGRAGEGGKYTCGLPRIASSRGADCVVYSFGVVRESSWEAEILDRTECEIFMYDFSVDKYGPQLEAMSSPFQARAHFFNYGIGGRDEIVDGDQFYTLKTLMSMNGHDWIDILKVDVEGAEFRVLPEIIADFGENRLPFDQMLMEIHAEDAELNYSMPAFGAWWKQMEDAGLRAYSSEINYPAIHWDPFPQAMEMNFLNYGARIRSKGGLLYDD